MFVEIALDSPRPLTGASLLSHAPVFHLPIEIDAQTPDGQWHLMSKTPAAVPLPAEDLRKQAAAAIRTAGFRYLLAPAGESGNGPIGNAILGNEPEWGLERIGQAGSVYLWAVSSN
jgi:hypothetical protein